MRSDPIDTTMKTVPLERMHDNSNTKDRPDSDRERLLSGTKILFDKFLQDLAQFFIDHSMIVSVVLFGRIIAIKATTEVLQHVPLTGGPTDGLLQETTTFVRRELLVFDSEFGHDGYKSDGLQTQYFFSSYSSSAILFEQLSVDRIHPCSFSCVADYIRKQPKGSCYLVFHVYIGIRHFIISQSVLTVDGLDYRSKELGDTNVSDISTTVSTTLICCQVQGCGD